MIFNLFRIYISILFNFSLKSMYYSQKKIKYIYNKISKIWLIVIKTDIYRKWHLRINKYIMIASWLPLPAQPDISLGNCERPSLPTQLEMGPG